MCLHCISLSVMPVLCACFGMFCLSISVGGELLGQLREGLGRTGGWGACELRGSTFCGVCVCASEVPVSCCRVFCHWLRRAVTRFELINVCTSTFDWTLLCHRQGHYNIMVTVMAHSAIHFIIEGLRVVYGPVFTQHKGLTDPLRPCGPSLRPLQGPDVRLPKMLTFRRDNTAARAVIGPLTKT